MQSFVQGLVQKHSAGSIYIWSSCLIFLLRENLGSKLSSFPSSNLKHHGAERDMSNVNAGAMSLLFFLFSSPE